MTIRNLYILPFVMNCGIFEIGETKIVYSTNMHATSRKFFVSLFTGHIIPPFYFKYVVCELTYLVMTRLLCHDLLPLS